MISPPVFETACVKYQSPYWKVFLVKSGEIVEETTTLEQAEFYKNGYNRAVDRAQSRLDEFLQGGEQ